MNKDFNYISGKKYDGMMGRCYRKTNASYKNYGLRGIAVCSSWIKDIEVYRKWIKEELAKMNIPIQRFIENPKDFQVDRIDVNGHYEPNNCRLSSKQQNARNRRTTKLKTVISAEGETIYI